MIKYCCVDGKKLYTFIVYTLQDATLKNKKKYMNFFTACILIAPMVITVKYC